ncbi:MAG: hypothetical protein WDZ51_18955 [Pirellulaceae bacterium]
MSVASTIIESPNGSRISQRRNAILALYGLSAFWGVTQVVAPENPSFYAFSTLAFATLATMWFWLDRRILARPHLSILFLLFFLTWPIASFIHLLATRGLRGFGYWLIHALGLSATMSTMFILTMLLLFWLGVLDADAMFET